MISYFSVDNLTANLGAAGLNKLSNDKMNGTAKNIIYYNSGYYQINETTTVENNKKIGTKFDTISDDDFISVTAPEMGTDFDAVWRNADGSITTHGFMQVKDSSAIYTYKGASFAEKAAPPVVTTTTTPIVTTTVSEVSTTTETKTETVPTDSEAPGSDTTTATATHTETATLPVTTTSTNTDSETPSPTTTTTQAIIPGDVLLGDINMDGKVNLADAVLLNKAVSDTVDLNAAQRLNADCNADTDLDARDAQSLLRFLTHIIDSLPAVD